MGIIKLPASQPPEQLPTRPGNQSEMEQKPIVDNPDHRGSDKLKGKVAIITGGDSGIGQAVAIAFAKEGANVVISYLDEHEDAKNAQKQVESHGVRCLVIAGDVGSEAHCTSLIGHTIEEFGRLDIVVNNAAEQHPRKNLEDLPAEQLERTFRTNVYGMFFLSKAAIPHVKEGGSVLNTASVVAYRCHPELIDYAST